MSDNIFFIAWVCTTVIIGCFTMFGFVIGAILSIFCDSHIQDGTHIGAMVGMLLAGFYRIYNLFEGKVKS